MEKTLDISDVKGAKANISDLKVFGNGDLFQLLTKALSDSQRNPDGSYSIAEALAYVPGVKIFGDNVNGRYLAPEN